MYRLVLLVALFTLNGCGYHYIDMKMGYKHGQYKVAEYSIVPKDDAFGETENYKKITPMIEQNLSQQLQDKGQGRDIGIMIVMNRISLGQQSIVSQLFLENPYDIYSTVKFYDIESRNFVGEVDVNHLIQDKGIIANQIYGEDVDENTSTLLGGYMYSLMRSIYPPQED